MIIIVEAKTKKELTEYIKFPFSLYKNNTFWVPPIIADELETFDKTKKVSQLSFEDWVRFQNGELKIS